MKTRKEKIVRWLFRSGFGLCCLIIAGFAGMPNGACAHEGHHDTVAGQEGALVEKSGASPQASDWVEEKTGEFLPLDAEFTDSDGKKLTLRSIITKPTVILPVYFYCPGSCSLNLSYLTEAIKSSTLKPLTDFQVIAFSFDHGDTVADAANAKGNYLKQLPENFPAQAWTFMVGSPKSVRALTSAIGFGYKRMADGTYVHPSVLVAVSSEGRIIKYVYGSFLPGDVDMALLEAKKGTPAQSVKRLLGFCLNYDTKTNDAIIKWVKIGILSCSLVLGIVFFAFLRRGGKKRMPSA
jgi:protein SCO1/2